MTVEGKMETGDENEGDYVVGSTDVLADISRVPVCFYQTNPWGLSAREVRESQPMDRAGMHGGGDVPNPKCLGDLDSGGAPCGRLWAADGYRQSVGKADFSEERRQKMGQTVGVHLPPGMDPDTGLIDGVELRLMEHVPCGADRVRD